MNGEKLILSTLNEELKALDINYYYMINDETEIKYPYVTGEYSEISYVYEENSTTGEILLDCFTRGSELELIDLKNKIKSKFKNYQRVIDKTGIFIGYLGKYPRRTDDLGLKKLEIRLQIKYWESVL